MKHANSHSRIGTLHQHHRPLPAQVCSYTCIIIKANMRDVIYSTYIKSWLLFALQIGRGWPINTPWQGPDQWLSTWWSSVKCVMNPGHGLKGGRNAWQRVPFTWVNCRVHNLGQLVQISLAFQNSFLTLFKLWVVLIMNRVSANISYFPP